MRIACRKYGQLFGCCGTWAHQFVTCLCVKHGCCTHVSNVFCRVRDERHLCRLTVNCRFTSTRTRTRWSFTCLFCMSVTATRPCPPRTRHHSNRRPPRRWTFVSAEDPACDRDHDAYRNVRHLFFLSKIRRLRLPMCLWQRKLREHVATVAGHYGRWTGNLPDVR